MKKDYSWIALTDVKIVSDRDAHESETVTAVICDPDTGAIREQISRSLPQDQRGMTQWPTLFADVINENSRFIAAGTEGNDGELLTDLTPAGIPVWDLSGEHISAFTTSPYADNWRNGLRNNQALLSTGDLVNGEILHIQVTGKGFLYESFSLCLPEPARRQFHWPFYLCNYINSHSRYIRAGEKNAPDENNSDRLFSPRYSDCLNYLWVPASSPLVIDMKIMDTNGRDVTVIKDWIRPGLKDRLNALFIDDMQTLLDDDVMGEDLIALEQEISTVTLDSDTKKRYLSLYHTAHRLLLESTIIEVIVDTKQTIQVIFNPKLSRDFKQYHYHLIQEEKHQSTSIAEVHYGDPVKSVADANGVWTIQSDFRMADNFRIEIHLSVENALRTYIVYHSGKQITSNAMSISEARLNALFTDENYTHLADNVTQELIDTLEEEVIAPQREDLRPAMMNLLDAAQRLLLQETLSSVSLGDSDEIIVAFSSNEARNFRHYMYELVINRKNYSERVSILDNGKPSETSTESEGLWMTGPDSHMEDNLHIYVRRNVGDNTKRYHLLSFEDSLYHQHKSMFEHYEHRLEALFKSPEHTELVENIVRPDLDSIEKEISTLILRPSYNKRLSLLVKIARPLLKQMEKLDELITLSYSIDIESIPWLRAENYNNITAESILNFFEGQDSLGNEIVMIKIIMNSYFWAKQITLPPASALPWGVIHINNYAYNTTTIVFSDGNPSVSAPEDFQGIYISRPLGDKWHWDNVHI